MALLKNIKVKDQIYDLGAKYDSDGQEIKSTYATQSSLDTTNAKVTANEESITTEISDRKTAIETLTALVNIINGDSETIGSFREAIKNLIGGAPEAYDTLKEIADKLATNDDLHTAIQSAITERATKTELSTQIGTVTKKITDLDVTDKAVTNQFVTSVSQEDGKIAVTRSGVTSSQISRTTGDIKATDVETALIELLGKINSTNSGKTVSLTSVVGDYTTTYTINQGGVAVDSIEVSNAPKVVQSVLYL